MADCLIVCRSMTYAQRADRAISRAGIEGARVTKIKNGFDKEGCVYGVKLRQKLLPEALDVLAKQGLTPRGVYAITSEGEYK